MMIILYSTGCPKCNILKRKLSEANINYDVVDDSDLMIKKGFTNVPMLEVDSQVMDFKEALNWLNNME